MRRQGRPVAGCAPCDCRPSVATQGPRTRVQGGHLKHDRGVVPGECIWWSWVWAARVPAMNGWQGMEKSEWGWVIGSGEVGEAPQSVSKQRALQRVLRRPGAQRGWWSEHPGGLGLCPAGQDAFWRSSTDLGNSPAKIPRLPAQFALAVHFLQSSDAEQT